MFTLLPVPSVPAEEHRVRQVLGRPLVRVRAARVLFP